MLDKLTLHESSRVPAVANGCADVCNPLKKLATAFICIYAALRAGSCNTECMFINLAPSYEPDQARSVCETRVNIV